MKVFLLAIALFEALDAASEAVERPIKFTAECWLNYANVCECDVKVGEEIIREVNSTHYLCRITPEWQTVVNKKKMNDEIEEVSLGFKEKCFPNPSGGCKCNEKDSQGNEVTLTFNNPDLCQATTRARRDASSQNVNDPVRQRAENNFKEVLKELKEKFKGLKDGCYPRPKGCLCVIGKTSDGRDITERRMKDVDCKCQEGVAAAGCPAA